MPKVKEAILHPAARLTIKAFPADVRKEIGKAIFDLQKGEKLVMPLSRPMPSVGAGVGEIRVRDAAGIYRVFYYVKSVRGILVFHAFVKKGQKTPQYEIELGQKRLKELL